MVSQQYIIEFLKEHPNSSTVEIARSFHPGNLGFNTIRQNVYMKCHTMKKQGYVIKTIDELGEARWCLYSHDVSQGCAA